MSEQLSFLKILCSLYSWGEYFSQFLRWFFATHFEDEEDVVITFVRSLKQVDIFVELGVSGLGGGVFGRWSGSSFCGANVLRAVGERIRARGVTSCGVVTGFSALEAAIFSDTFGLFSGGEFGWGDVVNIHGIRVSLGARERSGGLRMSSLKGLDVHFLCMESLGLFNPFIGGSGDDRHGKDHCGNSLINPQEELVNKGDVICDSSLASKVLEVGDILLESIVCNPIRAADGFLDEFG